MYNLMAQQNGLKDTNIVILNSTTNLFKSKIIEIKFLI
jgi:hypothetical protein